MSPKHIHLVYRYQRLGSGDINLDFAGTKPAGHAVHRGIAALSVGSRLIVRQEQNEHWVLCDGQGTIICKLSRSFKHPHREHCIEARVVAIHVRRIKDVSTERKPRNSAKCGQWETVIPELVFAPD